MKLVLLLGLFLFPFSTFAVDYKSADCEDSGFVNGAWQDVISQDPSILEQLKDIADKSGVKGFDVPMTNCWVKWPVDDKGQSIGGYRTVIMDKVWKSPGDKKYSHGGIKIIYFLKYERVTYEDGGTGVAKNRKVKGIALCRGPEACEDLAIPVARQKDEKGTASVPLSKKSVIDVADSRT